MSRAEWKAQAEGSTILRFPLSLDCFGKIEDDFDLFDKLERSENDSGMLSDDSNLLD